MVDTAGVEKKLQTL